MKKIFAAVGAGVAAAVAAVPAMAEVPAVIGTTVTAIQADSTDIFDTTFPVVASVIGLVIVVKLFKRFIAKI